MRWWIAGAVSVALVTTASAAAPATRIEIPDGTLAPAERWPGSPPPAPVTESILGTCSASVHDRFTALGPDGRRWRTWHPTVVPIDPTDPGAGTCTFAHEHGDDPSRSLADPSPPLFGYVAEYAGMPEVHEGFKVFVVNAGTRNDEGRVATAHTRTVVHMGTGGPRRFVESHHTLEFDLVAADGHEVHVQGMADTGLAGSICQRDASLGNASRADDVGRAVVVTRGHGCDAGGALYEIWKFELDVGAARVIASAAVFDPITVLDPSDPTRAVPTEQAYPVFGPQRGCDREAYHGPVYWYHATGPVEFTTTAHGNPIPADMPGAIVQYVSNHTDIGIPMNQDQTLMKLRSDACVPGLGPRN